MIILSIEYFYKLFLSTKVEIFVGFVTYSQELFYKNTKNIHFFIYFNKIKNNKFYRKNYIIFIENIYLYKAIL